ncbi:U32 family peptidase [uncultured Clostridium sp.]|uniref:U32 family peptidase n=1 Tax=uncultured Clostridium sp. TaxID=59620 RepID=UPI0025F4E925|nr:U32 family peptidase [uncultured Clostridium sp.]
MKIVAGLGSIDDYIDLVEAGADEVFCGYVPYDWNKKYGNLFPLNRREVLYYNVQIGSLTDMKILRRMMDKYKVPVTITFNYLYYLEEQYEDIEKIIRDLTNIGFNEYIIADIALITYLREKEIDCIIHLSGEASEINSLSVDFYNKLDISRYIFHRKNTILDMESVIKNNSIKNLEYEAFMLNERCHYTGAFCSSLHCDELAHLCKVPYHMAKFNRKSNRFETVDKKFNDYYKIDEEYDYDDVDEKQYLVGGTGCGLCALKKLQKAGVTHLKVVGRGNFIDLMIEDVKNLKKAINMLSSTENSIEFEGKVKQELFKGKCSGECYY